MIPLQLGCGCSRRGAGIRLAGATSDVHLMDVRSGKWEQMIPQGEPPSPRAAHAAAAVGSMVVIQGGIGPAGLASEDLHVLDFTDFDRPRWHRSAYAVCRAYLTVLYDNIHREQVGYFCKLLFKGLGRKSRMLRR